MIQINILAHGFDRFEFTSKSLEFLKKIKEENKKKIKLLICVDFNTEHQKIWEEKRKDLIKSNLFTELLFINNPGNNYMQKINKVIENSDCEFSCSMDDDILISNFLWDFIIENINVLQDEKNLFLAPLISNGIPTVDLFIEDFCDSEEKNELKNMFKNTKIENFWGVNYSSLNKEREVWDFSFYDDVKKINHYYKGIHPVRVSSEIHEKIALIICQKLEKFLFEKNFKIEKYNFPYFCNSFYFIKTNTWEKIIKDKSLYVDDYDEVPLNLYMQKNNLNMNFIRNGFCLHMAYNTIGNYKQKIIEKYFIENFIKKID
jgi:hypothetical protein